MRADTRSPPGGFCVAFLLAETAADEGPSLVPGRAVAEAALFFPLAAGVFFVAGVPVSKNNSREG